MRKNRFPLALMLIAAIVTSIAIACNSGNENNLNSPEANSKLPETWSNTSAIRWTYDLEGRGWSSPVVYGNKVFITSAVNETTPPKPEEENPAPPPPRPAPQPQQSGQAAPRPAAPQGPPQPRPEDTTYKSETWRMELICLDLKSGQEIWKTTAFRGTPATNSHRGNGYASETPVTDGKYVYARFAMNGIYCFDMKGKLIWKQDPGAFRTLNGWGTGSSPVLYNGLLYVQYDNEESSFIAAYDAKTGTEKWRTPREEKTSYSTPYIWINSIRAELIAGGRTIHSYNPETGELLWKCTMGGMYSIPTARSDKDLLFASNAGGPENPSVIAAFRAGASGDISPADSISGNEWIAWKKPSRVAGNPTPLIHDGIMYVLASNGGMFSAFNAATGDSIYSVKIDKAASCWASPWTVNGKIFALDERGVTYTIEPGREFKVLSQSRINDRFWATPAIAGDAYIFKGVRRIYCVGL